MSYISDIFVNVIAAFLIAFFSIIAYRLRYLLTARRLWQIKEASSYRICLSTKGHFLGNDIDVKWPVVSIGEVRSLIYLTPSLKSAYKGFSSFNIYTSDHDISSKLENDLILIGGPRGNRITKLMLEKMNLPFSFDGLTIRIDHNGSLSCYDLSVENGYDVFDHGLILKTKNPLNRSRSLLLFAGLGMHGTTAAARCFVTEFKRLKYLLANEFVAVVRTEIVDGHAGEPNIERFIKL